jgi:hypothetical protein
MRIRKSNLLSKQINFMQRDDAQDFEGFDEDIGNLSDNDQDPHLTRQYYERYLDKKPLFGDKVSINNMGDSDYQGITGSIMDELQQKYNLRPRDKKFTTDPPKKILSRSKKNELLEDWLLSLMSTLVMGFGPQD